MTGIHPLIAQHRFALAHACREFGVSRLELFGSAARGEFDSTKSDFDFIVRFADKTPGSYADRFVDFGDELQRLLGRSVDLLTERSIRNPYFRREVDAARAIVYDEPGQKETA